jgi:hypothetical protein
MKRRKMAMVGNGASFRNLKGSVGSHRLRWRDNINMDLKETVYEGFIWIYLALERDQWWIL